MKQPSVILLSGGLDSAANLAFCHEWDLPQLAITVRYGQRACEQEIHAAQSLCSYYGIAHQIVDAEWLGKIGKSALTSQSCEVPHLQIQQLDLPSIIQQSAKSVWVPNRNGILIHIAAAFAEGIQARRVLVGFNVEEAATFPDNSVNYLRRVNEALEYSTSNQVQVFSYTAEWDKSRIVRELRKLSRPFPFKMIWSCYEGLEKPCGHCESCQRLRRALEA